MAADDVVQEQRHKNSEPRPATLFSGVAGIGSVLGFKLMANLLGEESLLAYGLGLSLGVTAGVLTERLARRRGR